jgi:hypothetical protein
MLNGAYQLLKNTTVQAGAEKLFLRTNIQIVNNGGRKFLAYPRECWASKQILVVLRND